MPAQEADRGWGLTVWLSMAGRARARLGPAQADHSSPLLVSPRNLPVISPNLPVISPQSPRHLSSPSPHHLLVISSHARPHHGIHVLHSTRTRPTGTSQRARRARGAYVARCSSRLTFAASSSLSTGCCACSGAERCASHHHNRRQCRRRHHPHLILHHHS